MCVWVTHLCINGLDVRDTLVTALNLSQFASVYSNPPWHCVEHSVTTVQRAVTHLLNRTHSFPCPWKESWGKKIFFCAYTDIGVWKSAHQLYGMFCFIRLQTNLHLPQQWVRSQSTQFMSKSIQDLQDSIILSNFCCFALFICYGDLFLHCIDWHVVSIWYITQVINSMATHVHLEYPFLHTPVSIDFNFHSNPQCI